MRKVFSSIMILLITVLAFLYYDDSMLTGFVVKGMPTEEGPVPLVYFCPRDNCTEILKNTINSAQESVHCAFYDLELIDILSESTNVVMDEDHYDEVKESFDNVILSDSPGLMHNKFCIIDDKIVTTGSFNPTYRGANKNNNNLVIFSSVLLARVYRDEFQELASGVSGKGKISDYNEIIFNNKSVKIYFCPEESCGDMIMEELRKAKKSIHFMTFSFTHSGIANVLAAKVAEGVTVSGVYEKSKVSKYTKYNFLESQGAELKPDSNKYNMHHKVFIIDEKIVITGSFNPSKNADTRNDENVLIVDDEKFATEYVDEFYRLHK